MNQDQVTKEAFRYKDALISHAFSYLKDWALAEDVVQESFLVVFNKWQEFEPGSNLYAWLKKIVFYKSQEMVRARSKTLTVGEEGLLDTVNSLLENNFSHAQVDSFKQRRIWLQECIAKLNTKSIKIINDYYWSKLRGEDIAQKYNFSVNVVRLTLMRSRETLQKCIALREQKYE